MREPANEGSRIPISFKSAVLTGKKRFQALFENGRPSGGPGIRLLAYKYREKNHEKYGESGATGEKTLLAICVSKRTGKAVFRNRLKRITREALTEVLPNLRSGYYVALFPSQGFDRQDYRRRVESLTKLFRGAGLLEKSK